MKKLILVASVFLSIHAIAQVENDCGDLNKPPCCPSIEDGYIPKIPPVEDICKSVYKIAEYDMFPKILEYKGFIFREVVSCAVQNMENNMSFYYCIPKTRQNMKVNITDFSDPFFETKAGKASKEIDLFVFSPNAIAFGAHSVSPLNKIYKVSVVASARFSPYGGKDDGVSYIAYINERYLIEIIIDDKAKRFTEPIQVEEFVKDYVSQINLIEK